MRTTITLDGTEGPMYPTSTAGTDHPCVVGGDWSLFAPPAVLRDIAAACLAAAEMAEMPKVAVTATPSSAWLTGSGMVRPGCDYDDMPSIGGMPT